MMLPSGDIGGGGGEAPPPGATQDGGSTISLVPENVFPASWTGTQGGSDIAIEPVVLTKVLAAKRLPQTVKRYPDVVAPYVRKYGLKILVAGDKNTATMGYPQTGK